MKRQLDNWLIADKTRNILSMVGESERLLRDMVLGCLRFFFRKLKVMVFVKVFALLFYKIWSFFDHLLRRNMKTIIQHQAIKYDICELSPISAHRLNIVKRKIMVLDLDETLVHSHTDGLAKPSVKPSMPPDFTVKVTIDRHPVRFHVHKRPHADFFLSIVSQWYDLAVFTASMEVYGAAVTDQLDRNKGVLNRRYFRQHCKVDIFGFTKDLRIISSDLSSIFIIDNSPGAYRENRHNGIPIVSWFADPSDKALLNLLPVLDALRFTSDVRSILSRNLLQSPY